MNEHMYVWEHRMVVVMMLLLLLSACCYCYYYLNVQFVEEFCCKAKIVCTLPSRRLNLYSVSVSDMDFASSLRTLKKTATIKAIKAV